MLNTSTALRTPPCFFANAGLCARYPQFDSHPVRQHAYISSDMRGAGGGSLPEPYFDVFALLDLEAAVNSDRDFDNAYFDDLTGELVSSWMEDVEVEPATLREVGYSGRWRMGGRLGGDVGNRKRSAKRKSYFASLMAARQQADVRALRDEIDEGIAEVYAPHTLNDKSRRRKSGKRNSSGNRCAQRGERRIADSAEIRTSKNLVRQARTGAMAEVVSSPEAIKRARNVRTLKVQVKPRLTNAELRARLGLPPANV